MRENFGTAPDGSTVERVTISGGGLRAQIMTFGAVIQDMRLEGHDAPLILGFETLQDYIDHVTYFGAVVGRFANRVSDGRFTLDGRSYAIEPEHAERNGLHGGTMGYGRRNWTILEQGTDTVTLALSDPDGTMGFPGNVEARCTYKLAGDAMLRFDLTATTDAPTIVNFAQHAYFNLDDGGTSDVLKHRLQIAADAYLPTDDRPVPTGEIRKLAGGDMDFQTLRPIGLDEGRRSFPYDHNYCLARDRRALSHAATATGASSGLEMQVWTTEPGLQFYAGQKIPDGLIGLEGRTYRPHSGFCLEAQVWPDSPNRPDFPQAVLRPAETYRQTTEWRFSRRG